MKLLEADSVVRTHDEAWDALLALLPPGPELESVARTTGALCRSRGVKGPTDLLRVALSYGFGGLSLAMASAWARVNGSGILSKRAVLKRLENSGTWLEKLLSDKLSARLPTAPSTTAFRVRLVDATRVKLPGNRGRCWRVHVAYDPWTRRLLQVELTDDSGGERMGRFRLSPGDLAIGDRGYAHRRGLAYVVSQGAHFLVRMNWYNVPLVGADGRPFALFEQLKQLGEGHQQEFDVTVAADARNGLPALPCRLVAYRKCERTTEAARKKLRREAQQQKRKLDPRSLEACAYVLVLTSVAPDKLSTDQALNLYRLRWQVELEFKRLKSLLALDDLRAKKPSLVRAALAAKMLGAVLVEELVAQRQGHTGSSVSHWQLTSLLGDVVRHTVLGLHAFHRWLEHPELPRLLLAESKRQRQPQCKAVAALFA